jgi:hypothetical protein
MLRRLLIYGAIAFAVFFVYSSPDGAANVIQGALSGLADIGNQFAAFLQTLLT